jgi:hypothetical protein
MGLDINFIKGISYLSSIVYRVKNFNNFKATRLILKPREFPIDESTLSTGTIN